MATDNRQLRSLLFGPAYVVRGLSPITALLK